MEIAALRECLARRPRARRVVLVSHGVTLLPVTPTCQEPHGKTTRTLGTKTFVSLKTENK